MSQLRSIRVGDVDLETEVMGAGEPVVVIQTALTADELRPLAEQLARTRGYQVIHYHRRGYAGSGPSLRPGSVTADVADCRALLRVLEVGPTHLAGASYSAAIALSLASTDPDTVRTLTVMEPPPLGVPSAPEFLAACVRLAETFNAQGSVDDISVILQQDLRSDITMDEVQVDRLGFSSDATPLVPHFSRRIDRSQSCR